MNYRRTTVLLCTFALASSALAQISNRHKNACSAIVNTGAEYGHLGFDSGATPTDNAKLVWTFSGLSTIPTLSLPFNYAGDLLRVSSFRYLVSGYSPATQAGAICRVRLDDVTEQVILEETVTLSGLDPYEFAWDRANGLLAVADVTAGSQALWVAPFTGWPVAPATASLPAQALFVEAVKVADAPALGGHRLNVHTTPPGVGGFRITPDGFSRSTWITPNGSGWDVAVVSTTMTPHWQANDEKGHMGPLLVHSTNPNISTSNPESFDVTDTETSVVVASGTQTDIDDWVSVVPPTEFYDFPGREYVVSGTVSGDSKAFRPLVRYGEPFETAPYIPGRGFVEAENVYVGSPEFLTGSSLKITGIDAVAPTPQAVNATLVLAFNTRGPGAPPDPYVEWMGMTLLVGAINLPIAHTQKLAESGCAVAMSIPNDPGLDGLIVLMQMLYQDPANPSAIAATDVYGVRIASSPQAAAMSGGGGGAGGALLSQQPAAASASSPASACAAAAQAWRTGDPRFAVSTQSPSDLLECLHQIQLVQAAQEAQLSGSGN